MARPLHLKSISTRILISMSESTERRHILNVERELGQFCDNRELVNDKKWFSFNQQFTVKKNTKNGKNKLKYRLFVQLSMAACWL